jgi:hypothetical protein
MPVDARRKHDPKPAPKPRNRQAVEPDTHEGATDEDVSDRTGPGVGYDSEPERVKDKGGVAES